MEGSPLSCMYGPKSMTACVAAAGRVHELPAAVSWALAFAISASWLTSRPTFCGIGPSAMGARRPRGS
jgi:hypothetical protein